MLTPSSMKSSRSKTLLGALLSAIVIGVGAWTRVRSSSLSKKHNSGTRSDARMVSQADETAVVTQRYLLYFTVPLWVIAGSLDYLWHRRTKIETTSGTLESAIHALMMTEAGIPMFLGLLLEINAGVILLMITAFFAHAGTAIWDVAYAVERRKVTPNEQHVHSFLEVLPFCAVSFVICLHWPQFASLFGYGSEKPRFELKKKEPSLPAELPGWLSGSGGGQRGCLWRRVDPLFSSQRRGLNGTDTPEAAQELYAGD